MSDSNQTQTDDSSMGIIVRYMEKTVKLEEDRKRDRQDLQDQISSVREDTTKMVDERLSSFGERFDSLDKKLEDMSKPKEEPPTNPDTPPTETNVDDVTSGGTVITNQPTEIHPPPVPKGHRGRRKYRKDHRSE